MSSNSELHRQQAAQTGATDVFQIHHDNSDHGFGENSSVLSDDARSYEDVNPFEESLTKVHAKSPVFSNQERISSLPKLNVLLYPDSLPERSHGKEKILSAASTSYENPLRSFEDNEETQFNYLNAYSPYFRNSSTYAQSELSFDDTESSDDNGKSKVMPPSPVKLKLLSAASSVKRSSNQLERKNSILIEALQDDDLPALKDGFKEALGSRTSMGMWLPLEKPASEDADATLLLPQKNIVVQDEDNGIYDEQPRGAIKLQNLPLNVPKNDPSIELLSPNYPQFRRNSADSEFHSTLEDGLGPNASSHSINSANSELKRHLTLAFQKLSSRIVHGSEADANLKRLSQVNNSNVSILNDEHGVSDLSKTEEQTIPDVKEITEASLELPFVNPGLLSENITAPENAYNNTKLPDMVSNVDNKDDRVRVRVHVQEPLELFRDTHIYDRGSSNYNRKLGLYGKSLKLFDPYNSFRVSLARMLQGIPDVFFLVIYIIHGAILAYQEWNPPLTHGYYYSKRFDWVDLLVLVTNVVFTVEIVAKIISYGFYDNSSFYEEFHLERKDSAVDKLISKVSRWMRKPAALPETDQMTLKHSFTIKPMIVLTKSELDNLKDPFLRNNWNVIDFVSCIAYWMSLVLSVNKTDAKHSLFIFRALACIRIFRLARLTEGTFTILRSLEHALPQLANICLFMLYFWVILSIAGVQTFKSSFQRQCVYKDPNNANDTFINTDDYQFCGAWLDPQSGKPQPYLYQDGLSSDSIKGYFCPRHSQCIAGQNPYDGTVSFDNIFHSMELVYVVLSMNTFTDIMYYSMDAENMAAAIFYIVAIFLMSIWLLNIFVAVIVSSFKITSELDRPNTAKKQSSFFDFLFATKLRKQGLPYKIAGRVEQYHRFEVFWVIIIAVDTMNQAFRKADSSPRSELIINTIELVITYILLLEILMRFVVFLPYWRHFFCYKRNQFDLVLAVVTSVIVVPSMRRHLGQIYNWLTIFQILRFYRVVVAVRFVRDLWLNVIGNFKTIGNLTLFYFLLLFLYSIVTSAYFEGFISHDDMLENEYQFALNTLPNTFIALYVVTSTENWTQVLYTMQQNAKTPWAGAVGSIIIIGWFIFSNSIILNIFIAVIAENLEVSEHEKKKQQVRAFVRNMVKSLTAVPEKSLLENARDRLKRRRPRDNKSKAPVSELFALLMTGTIVDSFLEDEKKQLELKQQEKKVYQNSFWYNNRVALKARAVIQRCTNLVTKNPFYARRQVDIEDSINPNVLAKNILMEDKIMAAHQRRYLENNPSFNTVLYIFAPKNRLRRFCQMFVSPSVGERIDGRPPDKTLQEIFNVVMLVGTIGIVVVACYATPLYTHAHNMSNKIWYWTVYADLAFALLFTLEAAVKIVADGLVFTPNAMLRSSWNVIDGCVLVTLWLNLVFTLGGNGSQSRIVRGFKALRALRLLTLSDTAKKTFHRIIIAGFGKILGAAAVSFCLLYPFSLWGLNIFNGRLGVCNDNSLDKDHCIGEYQNNVFDWDVVLPRSYENPYLYFDSLPHSFSTLFQISSLEGWVDLLGYVTQSTGKGTVVAPYAQPLNAAFLVIYMFLAIIFILNLFVSVIISNYARTSGSAYLTNEQRSWNEVQKLLKKVTPTKRPAKEALGPVKLFIYNLVIEKNRTWQFIYDSFLFVQLVILLMETADNSKAVQNFRNAMFLINATFFFANSCLKLFVKGFNSLLFKNKWDTFQFLVSGHSLVFQIILMNTSASTNVIPNLARAFSLCIIVFIIQRSNRLSLLLKFASASLPSLLSLLYTWFILFMVYAIAMNQIFGMTKIGENGSGNLNVRTVTKSLIVLFKMSFGEGWNSIMNDYYVAEPYCLTTQGYSDCGNVVYAHILFISWNVISMFIFLNLFISLVVENFSYVYHRTGPCSLITRQEIRKFKQTWMKFDPEGTGFIAIEDFYQFLHSLNGVLSFKLYDGRLSIKNLSKDWFTKVSNLDPYDFYIDYNAMQKTLNSIDVKKVRHRKAQFERFVEEAVLDMEVNHYPGISFTKVLMQIPLYTQFQDGECLSLNDYLERHLVTQKLDKRIAKKKRIGARRTFIDRWRFLQYLKTVRKS